MVYTLLYPEYILSLVGLGLCLSSCGGGEVRGGDVRYYICVPAVTVTEAEKLEKPEYGELDLE